MPRGGLVLRSLAIVVLTCFPALVYADSADVNQVIEGVESAYKDVQT